MRATRTTCMLALATAMLTAAAGAEAAGSSSRHSHTIWRIAGNGTQCSTPPACAGTGVATGALLSLPEAVAVARDGTVYIADSGDDEVRKVSTDGRITLFAGTGTPCQKAPKCGDGHPAPNAQLNFPDGVAVDGKGNVYIADAGDNEIRVVSRKGIITRLAGTGDACAKPPACGDGGRAPKAQLTNPTEIAVDRHGNLYIADTGDQEIRRISTSGKIGTVVGTGVRCSTPTA